MDEDVDSNDQNDEYDDEPLFADDIEDDDDIPLPPSPINEDAFRQRARMEISASRRDGIGQGDADITGFDLGGANVTTVNDTTEQPVPIKKRKPLLTLGPDRLIGERGFKVLHDEFPKIKFKGNGHEGSDLKLLLRKYELWAHRLFPKMTFRDVLDRVQKLEKDKEVKSCLHQMRYGRDFRATVEDSDSENETSNHHHQPQHNQQHQNDAETQGEVTPGNSVHDILSDSGNITSTKKPVPGQAQDVELTSVTGNGTIDSDSDEEWNMLGRRNAHHVVGVQSENVVNKSAGSCDVLINHMDGEHEDDHYQTSVSHPHDSHVTKVARTPDKMADEAGSNLIQLSQAEMNEFLFDDS